MLAKLEILNIAFITVLVLGLFICVICFLKYRYCVFKDINRLAENEDVNILLQKYEDSENAQTPSTCDTNSMRTNWSWRNGDFPVVL